MRAITFRAWDKGKLRMFPVVGIKWRDGVMVEVAADDERPEESETGFHDLELMQFTGLKSKSGVEIYEGDVVEDEWKTKHEVRIERFNGGGYDSGVSGMGFALDDSDIDKLEVIGNIYENPELTPHA